MACIADRTKRLYDIVLSLLGLILFAPLMAVIALIVKLTSGGPVLYRGPRVGQYNKQFHILKYRTMIADAELLGGSATARDDPRITPIGRFLRRFKLDELPQFINVLKGEMSVVGPRPEMQEYADLYSKNERIILQLRPGITDWASIWNSNEEAVLEGSRNPQECYEELVRPTKVALQLYYARNHSWFIDLKITLHTIIKLFHCAWVPRELKAYGKVQSYRVLNETCFDPPALSRRKQDARVEPRQENG